jgi:hypothetical protein
MVMVVVMQEWQVLFIVFGLVLVELLMLDAAYQLMIRGRYLRATKQLDRFESWRLADRRSRVR